MEHHYDAFISCSHTPLDYKLAADIQSGLEHFPIPRALQKRLSKKRIGPIYLDSDKLPDSTSLGEDTEMALRNADYLIVICSTHTAESAWVQKEIETFLQDHDRQHILAVSADGTTRDVIPDILYHEVNIQDADGEPLIWDYRGKQSTDETLLCLAAAILVCSASELRQQQSKRKVRQIVAGFTAALLLVSAAAAFAANRAIVSAQQAEQLQKQLQEQDQEQNQEQDHVNGQELSHEEHEQFLINQSRYLAEKSGELLAQGDRIGAIQVALAALPASEEDNSRPIVTEALYALNNAVYPYHMPMVNEFLPKCMMKISGINSYDDGACYYETFHRFSPDGTRWLTADHNGQITVFDLEQYTQIAVLTPLDVIPGKVHDQFLAADFLTDDQIVLYLKKSTVCWDLQTNSAVWTTEYAPMPEPTASYDMNEYYCGDSFVDAEHRSLIAALYKYQGEIGVYQFDAATGEIQSAIILPVTEDYSSYIIHAALSPDGTKVAVGAMYLNRDNKDSFGPRLMLVDLVNESYQMVSTAYADIPTVTFLSNDQVGVLTTDLSKADTSSTFSYAVELYHFEDGSLVWSSPDEITVSRDIEEWTYPSTSIQFWHRDLEDGENQDLLVLQFGNRLLLLDSADGHVVQRESFSSDILDCTIYNDARLYLTMKSGKMVRYISQTAIQVDVGNISLVLSGACFNPMKEEFLLLPDTSQDIVVMSNQFENPDGISLPIDTSSTIYYANHGREYRVLEVADSLFSSEIQLLFYTPFSDTPIASTDGDSRKSSILINFAEDCGADEDICYYIEDAAYDALCGWGLESNQKVFEYKRGSNTSRILGFYGNQILLFEDTELFLIDPVRKTEKAAVVGNESGADDIEFCCGGISPNGKFAAVVAYNVTDGYEQLHLVDVENWSWVEIPEELQMQRANDFIKGSTPSSSYTYNGNLSFSQDSSKLAVRLGGVIRILDLNTMTVSQHVQISCNYNGYSMFLNDHILLVHGDALRFISWDLDTQSVVMVGPYCNYPHGIQLSLGDGYFSAGQLIAEQSDLYAYDEDGNFTRYLSLGHGYVSPNRTEVLNCYNEYDANGAAVPAIKVYPLYKLDDLVAMANEILDGRTLTETERNQYLIG